MMLEIFKTNVQEKADADRLLEAIRNAFPGTTVNFDLNDPDRVLRVEAQTIHAGEIIATVHTHGFSCMLIPDKICR